MENEDKLYKKAKHRVHEKMHFYKHLYSYIIVNVILFLINLFGNWGNWSDPWSWWFLWVTFFWGIGLISHFLRTFVFYNKFDNNWEEEKIQEEMRKMKK